MKRLRDLKFSTKILLGLFIPLFLVCTTLGIYMINRMSTEFGAHIDEKGYTVTKLLAKFSVIPIITHDYWILEDYTAEVMADKEIVYAVVRDDRNKPLTSAGNSSPDSTQKQYRAYSVPVYHNKRAVGEVEVHVSTARYKEILIHERFFFTGLIIGTLVLCYIASYLIAKATTRPLSEIVRLMKEVQHGNFGIRQEVGRTDEIGSLAQGLNEMLEHIENRNKELLRAGELLEKEIQEKQTIEKQLQQSQKMEAIGTLAGGVAHDFNNILTTIIGYSQLILMEKKENDPDKENIEAIYEAAEKATELVRQLLAFSRKQVMDIKVIYLNDLVTSLLKMLQRLIGENIDIILKLKETIGNISADPGQVEQVIINLVVNAKDAMPDGGTLYLESDSVMLDESYCQSHTGIVPGQYIMFSVTDSGKGIPPDVKDKIFDPFFTTKKEGKGTGLGLATVYGIISQMKGHIYVYSELDQGTTFKIYFPEVREEVEVTLTEKAALVPGSETLLVVDDESSILRVMNDMLQPLGYTVLTAASAEEALDLFKSSDTKIDLVITDVIMKKMNGMELKKALKSLKPDTKVLFMSGYTDNIVAEKGIIKKGVNFIPKPLIPTQVTKKIRYVLGSGY